MGTNHNGLRYKVESGRRQVEEQRLKCIAIADAADYYASSPQQLETAERELRQLEGAQMEVELAHAELEQHARRRPAERLNFAVLVIAILEGLALIATWVLKPS